MPASTAMVLSPSMRTLPWLAVPLALALAAPAAADNLTSDDLFREGVLLFGRGEIAAACDRFERSYKMDAAPGTLFNLASCHEKQGRLWRARLDYLDLVQRATAAGKLDKAKLSRDRLASVEARLPKVALIFPAGSNVATIVLDDASLAPETWHDPVPVDPERGTHAVEFRAPARATVQKTITITGAAVLNVDVPLLQPEPAVTSTPGSAPPASTPTTVPATEPASDAPRASQKEPPPPARRSVPVAGYVLLGTGVVALGVGTFFAFQAASQKSDADAACGSSTGVCPTAGQTQAASSKFDDYRTSAIVSGVGFGLGAIAVGVGLYMVLSTPGPSSTSLLLTPMVGQGSTRLTLVWRF
jgi:hypothetical protein